MRNRLASVMALITACATAPEIGPAPKLRPILPPSAGISKECRQAIHDATTILALVDPAKKCTKEDPVMLEARVAFQCGTAPKAKDVLSKIRGFDAECKKRRTIDPVPLDRKGRCARVIDDVVILVRERTTCDRIPELQETVREIDSLCAGIDAENILLGTSAAIARSIAEIVQMTCDMERALKESNL